MIYKIVFYNQQKVYEIYARQVDADSMYGFIEVSDLLFEKPSKLLVDPNEERLKTEFENVQHTYIPLHCLIRIDVVDQKGVAKVSDVSGKDNVMPFPMPTLPPNSTD